MKKLLTVLLALLVVTGVVFADNQGSESKPELLLKATAQGDFWHGFSETSKTGSDIKTGAGDYAGEESGGVVVNIEGENVADQFVSFYGLYITQKENVNIGFSSTWVLVGDEHAPDWKVPFKLNVKTNDKDETRLNGTLKNSTNTDAEEIGTGYYSTEVISPSAVSVITTDTSYVTGAKGPGWISLELEVTFADNTDELPEASYTGTIIAEIVSI